MINMYMVGLGSFVTKVFDWLRENVANVLVNLVIAVIIILIGFSLGKFLGKLLKRILAEIEIDRLIKTKKKSSLKDAISESFSVIIYFVTILLALNELGVTSFVVYITLGALLIIFVLSFFLGFRDFVPNFFASVLIYNKKLFSVGDKIECGGVKGTVEKFTFLETQLKTDSNDILHVPNSYLYKRKVRVLKKVT